jgi:hypothetical protein
MVLRVFLADRCSRSYSNTPVLWTLDRLLGLERANVAHVSQFFEKSNLVLLSFLRPNDEAVNLIFSYTVGSSSQSTPNLSPSVLWTPV